MTSGRAIAGGFLWTGGASYIGQVLSATATLLLAKYVPVADLGIFSLASLVIGWLALVRGMGLGVALLHEGQDIHEASTTAFWLLLAAGTLLAALSLLAAPLAARAFSSPAVQPVVQVLGVSFILYGLTSVQETLLIKELRFRVRALTGLAGTLVYTALAIFLAIQGLGVWSIVYAQLAQMVCQGTIFWVISPFRPSFHFNWAVAKRLLRFGNFVFLNDALIFLILTLDRPILGRTLGVVTVGHYDFAYRLGNYPQSMVTNNLYSVILPVFTRLRGQTAELKRVYLTTLRFITYLSAPIAFALVLLGPPFLRLLYGDKWLPAIPLLQTIAFFGLISAIAGPTGSVFYGMGKPVRQLLIHIVKFLALFPALYFVALSYGAMGVAVYVTAVSLALGIVSILWTNHMLAIRPIEYASAIIGPLALAGLLAAAGLAATPHLPVPAESVPGFLILAAGFGVAYTGLLLIFDRNLRAHASSLLTHPVRTFTTLLAEGDKKG